GGQGGDPFIEEIELFTLEGPDQERILRQRAFLTYSGEFLAYADVEDTFLGEMYWDFVYTPSGKLEFFALYDSIDDIVAGQYFYTEDGLVESVGIINYQPGPVDTVYISFEYNDVGDVVKQIGPGEVELTFTYTDDVVNPNFWLPEAVQLMVQNSPEMALLGIDYSYRSFLSVVPKNKAIASVTDQEGNIITYENFSESGQLNAAQSVNGLIDYEFGRCGF
ncbi:MAG TPA: hypothetical protein DCE41_01745, partial [Cytophagales bacterium]|nr:hypothetical protein [Cytophagales bacterium]